MTKKATTAMLSLVTAKPRLDQTAMLQQYIAFFCRSALLVVVLALSQSMALAEKSSTNMTHWVIEYGRGASSPTIADLSIQQGQDTLLLHDIVLQPEANSWADSNKAFFAKAKTGSISDSISALTEPYYAIRLHYYLPQMNSLGLGLSHSHFKVYATDYNQHVRVTGKQNGQVIDKSDFLRNYIAGYSLSHGVNHVSFNVSYRLMLLTSEQIPDGRIQPYVSLGLGLAVPHTEINYLEDGFIKASAYEYQASLRNLGFDITLGSRYKFTNHLGIYLEIKTSYTYAHGMRMSDGDDKQYQLQTDFLVNHIQFGFSVML